MHFIIVEDNKITNKKVSKMIKFITNNSKHNIKVTEFLSYNEQLNNIIGNDEEKIYILDIELGDFSGYDIARKIREEYNDWESIIIFISIHQIENKIIHDRLMVLTYVSKLDNFEKKLNISIKKAIQVKLNTIKIIINTDKGYKQIALKDILYIKKEKNSKYCIIETIFTNYRVRNTLANLKTQTNFKRFKKSFLVNENNISNESKDEILFKNGISI